MIAMTDSDQRRFLSKFRVGDDCWEWTASLNNHGYGQFRIGPRVGGRVLRSHRVSYELFVGPIPEGLTLDHLCRNRSCVRPDHLEPITSVENVRRGMAAQTHCKKGHPFDEANTRLDKRGWRQCRTCRRESEARRREVRA